MNLIKVNVLHAHVLHHGCLLVDVRCNHTKCTTALPEHSCHGHKIGSKGAIICQTNFLKKNLKCRLITEGKITGICKYCII